MLTLLLSTAAAIPSTAAPLAASLEEQASRPEPPVLPAEVGIDAHIINGVPAQREDWPMTGALIMSADVRFQGTDVPQTAMVCSSTLIAPDVVLTAAHCVDPTVYLLQGLQTTRMDFYWTNRRNVADFALGAPARELPEGAGLAKAVVMHPEWNLLRLQTGLAENKDIALLFLEEPILDVPLGYLPQRDTAEVELAVDDEVVVVGYGLQQNVPQGQQPPPNTYGEKMMGNSHVNRVAAYEFQVGAVATDVRKCKGDSGGPSYKQVETDSSEAFRVVGVTSHSWDTTECAFTGGVDTRVTHYLDWIEQTMQDACDDGTRVWCEIDGLIPPPLPDGTLSWMIPDEEPRKKGCSCDAGALPLTLAWLPLVALIRRRHRIHAAE